MRPAAFFAAAIGVAALAFAVASLIGNDYVFFAGYTVVQFIVLATAWNILGGYCGYVNFGTAAFFALGAYTTVFFHKAYPLPIPLLLVFAAGVSGVVGLGAGYLTLRLRGAFFSIATLALAVVLQTFVVNWDYVGGSRGAFVIRPDTVGVLGFEIGYVRYLCLIMLVLAAFAVAIARTIEGSKLGYGFAAIRDDELAAEASGVPTLKLKLIATTLSGALMGMAGAPFPYYTGYVEPASTFGLAYAVNAIAMPLIGGTNVWFGPVIGALLIGTLMQIATVTISSAVNLLLVGALLVGFVILAPNGVVGLIQAFLRVASPARLEPRSIGLVALAAFAFIAGVLEIVFGLAALTTPDPTGFMIAAGGLALAGLWTVSAYGLITIQRWSPSIATVAFALSIPVGALHIWLDRTLPNVALWGGLVAIAIVAVLFLQRLDVQRLYRGFPAKEAHA
jgi:branched-chain amino acid transport system permease protein